MNRNRTMLGSLPYKMPLALPDQRHPEYTEAPNDPLHPSPPKFPADGLPNLVVLTLIQPGFRL